MALLPGRSTARMHSLNATFTTDDRARVVEAVNEALTTGRPYWVRYRVTSRENREEHWIETSGTVTFKDGAPVRMVGICHDVTERIKLQEELRSRAKQQEALAQLGERALAETDIDRLLDDVVSTVALTLPVDFVKVLELMPGDNDLLLRAGFGWKESCVGSIVMSKERDGYARHILSAAAPLITADFASETRFAVPQYLRSHGCVSGMSTIVAGRDGRAYGVLGVCTSKQRQFSEQELLVPGRRCQPRGRLHSTPAIGAASRIDDPRTSASLRQFIFPAACAVFANRQKFPEHGGTCKQLSGPRHGLGERASIDHRSRLEIDAA